MSTLYEIIRRPLDTEKLDRNRDRFNEYAFEVARTATKLDVKNAVQQLFKVTVLGVRTQTVRGKSKRVGTFSGRRPNWKKAIVTLKQGDAISIFEGK